MRLLYSTTLLIPLTSALWPVPSDYTHGDTVLWIGRDVQVWYSGAHVGFLTDQQPLGDSSAYAINNDSSNINGNGSTLSAHDMINSAVRRAYATIFDHGLNPWKFHPRDWAEPQPVQPTYITSIALQQLQDDPDGFAKPLAGELDESYELSLTEAGKATITANSTIGLLRGLTTFTQLFYEHSEHDPYTTLAPVQIKDAPKFQHRGINLDVSRNWIPVNDIKRTIDAVAYNKLNRFHLHATDSQSWPLEIPSLPTLAKKGAYRPELIYTKEDFRDIQHHAAMQGVELITEIDMPGHTSSIWYSYPELIAAFNIQPNWDSYAAEPPSGTLKLNSTAVNDFLETLLDDLLPRVYPYTSYFHTGGDEVNKNAYTLDDTVRSSDPAVLQPLMQKFIDRNHDQVRAQGLTPVVWEEMLLDWNLTLGTDVIVQTWQSDEAVANVTAKGHKVLVGNYNYWYLDCGKGQWLDFPPSNAGTYWPFQDYCAPFHNWRLVYSYDPYTGVPVENKHLIIGGEAHLWAEQSDPVNLDRMLWPRGSAAAEILWSGAKDANGQNRSQVDASPRLSEFRERLVALGVGAEPIQMPYCTMNGTQCGLGLS